MSSPRPQDGCGPSVGKLIVVAGQEPWTGTVYTTRGGAHHAYHDQVELLKLIGRLTGWRECLSPTTASAVDGTQPEV